MMYVHIMDALRVFWDRTDALAGLGSSCHSSLIHSIGEGAFFLALSFFSFSTEKASIAGGFGFQRLDASAQGYYLLEGLVQQALGDGLALLGLELCVF
jgi:hypothetical protein